MPDENILRRLAFIKYLYNLGFQQSLQSEPMNSASVLTLHDSIELFFVLACKHLEIEGESSFIGYFDKIKTKSSGPLTQQASTKRLNDARVRLKHHGIFPSRWDVEEYRASTSSFFKDNTPTVFGIKFEDISLLDLVQSQKARDFLREANKLIHSQEFGKAIQVISIAFDEVINDYEARKITHYYHSPFFFGENMRTINRHGKSEFERKAEESITALQGAMKILSLGVDYRKYAKFRLLAPQVIRDLSGRHIFQKPENITCSRDDCEFCHDFVIESAIRIQDFDFDVEQA